MRGGTMLELEKLSLPHLKHDLGRRAWTADPMFHER